MTIEAQKSTKLYVDKMTDDYNIWLILYWAEVYLKTRGECNETTCYIWFPKKGILRMQKKKIRLVTDFFFIVLNDLNHRKIK